MPLGVLGQRLDERRFPRAGGSVKKKPKLVGEAVDGELSAEDLIKTCSVQMSATYVVRLE